MAGNQGEGAPQGSRPARKGRRIGIGIAIAAAAAVVAFVAFSMVGAQSGGEGSGAAADGGRPGQEGVVASPNVVSYDEGDEGSPFRVLASDADSVTLSSLDGLTSESILAAGVTDATPDGMLRHVDVDAAEPTDDGAYRVPTTQAALTDAIEYCDVTFTATLTDEGTYEVRDVSAGGDAGQGEAIIQQAYAASANPVDIQPAYADGASDVDVNWKDALPRFDEDGFKVGSKNLFSYEKNGLEASAGDVLILSMKIENKTIEMSVVNHLVADAEYGLHGGEEFNAVDAENPDADGSEPVTIFSKDLRPIEFAVGPVPVVITNNIKADLDVQAALDAGAFSIGGSIDKTFGFLYSSESGLHAVNEDASKTPGYTVELNDIRAELSLSSKVAVHYTGKLYDVAGPELSAGLAGESTASLHRLAADAPAEGFTIPGVDGSFAGNMSVKLFVPISGSFKLEVPFNVFDGSDSYELADAKLFDTDDAITLFDEQKQWDAPDGSYFDQETYETKALEGRISGSDGMPDPDAPIGSVPSLAFDYPADWTISNDTFGKNDTYGSVTVLSPDGTAAVQLSAKVGALGGAFSPQNFVEVAGCELGDPVKVMAYDDASYDYHFVGIMDTSTLPTPPGEAVRVGEGGVTFHLVGPDGMSVNPAELDPEVYRQAVSILSSLRLDDSGENALRDAE